MKLISSLFMPIIILFVIFYGFYKKNNIYNDFIEGAKESVKIVLDMFPCLLAMILSINILINSDIIEKFFQLFQHFFKIINLPIDIIPLALMRPISGTFGLGLLNDIYKQYGVDSFTSHLASVIQGSTDTTLYIITLYFGVIGIKKIKYALWAGLLTDLCTLIISIIIVSLFFAF